MDAINRNSQFQIQDHCAPANRSNSFAPASQAGGPNFGAIQQLGAGGLQGAQQLGQQFNGVVRGQGGPTVAVIDDFGSAHGQEIAGIINSQGVNSMNLDVNGAGS